MGHLGLNWPGTFAEYFRAPADRVAAVPDSLDPAVAALLEPTAVCLQSLRRGHVESGKTALILGDGPFGVLTARLAARQGARVAAIGRHPFRLQRTHAELTIHQSSDPDPLNTLRRKFDPDGVDTAILCVGSESALALACEALRTRGRLVVFSAITKPAAVNWFRVHVKELEIVGACNDEEQLTDVVPLLSDDTLALRDLVTHRFPLEHYKAAFQMASHAKDKTLKVAFAMEGVESRIPFSRDQSFSRDPQGSAPT
jgi:2-desacetyl-2-hydroxyethyl bacteriochlorophyllide A dehydrogenase